MRLLDLTGKKALVVTYLKTSVWVIPANEELMIARHTLACLRP